MSKTRNSLLNQEVTSAILESEQRGRAYLAAWQRVLKAESELSENLPHGLERDIAQRGRARAELVVFHPQDHRCLSMSDQIVLQEWLDTLANATTQVGSVAPAPVGTIFKIVGVALSSAAAIAKSGKDPVLEIDRIHSADPLVVSVKDEWKAELDRKFGKS